MSDSSPLSTIAWVILAIVGLLGSDVARNRLEAQVLPPSGTRFVASSRGSVFYPVECDAWERLSPSNLRFFESEALAVSAGYRRTTNRRCQPLVAIDRLVPLAAGQSRQDGPGRPVGVCVVGHIVDGDTLDCVNGLRIRLLLIDAPEDGRDGHSLRASLALEEMLPLGDSAVVALDVQERDRYGRLLAHLYDRQGVWLNRAMVRRGYAVPLVYSPNIAGVDAVRAAGDTARAEHAGLWRVGAFVCLPVERRAGRCGGGS